jgi:hypothetical protein
MLGDFEGDGDWARLLQATPVRTTGDYTLKGAYRLLFTLLIIVLAAALLWPHIPIVDRFAPNAATEIFGIIITLVFVHRLLYRQERARRMRASIGAYRRANWALARLIHVWADVVKGCHRGHELPATLPRLFAPHVIEGIGLLDVERPVSAESPETWAHRLGHELETSVSELNRIILAYGGVLDPAYTEAVDEIIDHPFVKLVGDLTRNGLDSRSWRLRMRSQRGHVDDFFRHLLITVALHNHLAAEAASVRSRGRSPRSGTLGMELERDHDLRIDTDLHAAWRKAEPTPGSLCA